MSLTNFRYRYYFENDKLKSQYILYTNNIEIISDDWVLKNRSIEFGTLLGWYLFLSVRKFVSLIPEGITIFRRALLR